MCVATYEIRITSSSPVPIAAVPTPGSIAAILGEIHLLTDGEFDELLRFLCGYIYPPQSC